MLEACKEQLNWKADRYVESPPEPQLLPLQFVPPVLDLKDTSTKVFVIAVGCTTIGGLLLLFVNMFDDLTGGRNGLGICLWFPLFFFGACVALLSSSFFLISLGTRLSTRRAAMAANGERPLENGRRQNAYAAERLAALKAAEAKKAAQDHRLRCQVRELEALIDTMSQKVDAVNRL